MSVEALPVFFRRDRERIWPRSFIPPLMLGVGLWLMNVGWDAFTATPQNVAYFLGSNSEYKVRGSWRVTLLRTQMMMLSMDASARMQGM